MRPPVRRLVSLVICVIAILGGASALAAPPPGHEGNCWWACNVAVKPWGTWAQFDISVPPHKALILEASLLPPKADGTWAHGTGTVATFQLGTATTWKTHLTGLVPDSHYYYVLRLEHQSSKSFRVGSFWTRRRVVTVRFDKIHVIDDSDWGAKGAGDFVFGFWVGPTWLGEYKKDVSSGEDINPNAQASHYPPPGSVDTVDVTVIGLENDDYDGPPVIEPGQWTAFWVDALQHGPFDRADAKKKIHLGPNTPTESQCNVNECPIEAQHFSMKSAPPIKGEVEYEVFGRYWVFYEPTGKAPKSVAQWVPKFTPLGDSAAGPSQSDPAAPKKKTVDSKAAQAAPGLPKGSSDAAKAGEVGGSVGRVPAQGPQVAARPPAEVPDPQVAKLRTDLGQLTRDLESLGQGSEAGELRQRVQALQARLDRGSLDPRALQELRQQTDTLRRQVDRLRSSPLPKP